MSSGFVFDALLAMSGNPSQCGVGREANGAKSRLACKCAKGYSRALSLGGGASSKRCSCTGEAYYPGVRHL